MLELEIGKIYKCGDNRIRKLTRIEDKYLSYSVPIGDSKRGRWMALSKTNRWEMEKQFVNGKIITEEESFQ